MKECYRTMQTDVEGVIIIEPTVYDDSRGRIMPLFSAWDIDPGLLERCGFLGHHVPKINVTISYYNVLRGIHASLSVGKIFSCLDGMIDFAVVDCRPGQTFGKWELTVLSDVKPRLIIVPPMVGTAYWVTSQKAMILYLWAGPFDGGEQLTFRYDDPRFGVTWPRMAIEEPILSERDSRRWPRLGD